MWECPKAFRPYRLVHHGSMLKVNTFRRIAPVDRQLAIISHSINFYLQQPFGGHFTFSGATGISRPSVKPLYQQNLPGFIQSNIDGDNVET